MTATYRLQLHAGFTFEDVRKRLPYFVDLGITHLYLSPVMQAVDGSTHGYDVVDPNRVSDQLGGEEGFAALVADVRTHGLQILLDIVPNHMSIAGTRNAWWMDVLENGSASYYAHFFDVDWSAGDRVTLPVLGERYGRALANGALGLVYDQRGFAIRVQDARYPIAPESLGLIVRRAGERANMPELAFIGDALVALPRDTTIEARQRRHRDKLVLSRRIGELPAGDALLAEVTAVNADKVELDALLEAQAYRLVHWSVATSELTYRRFFDINTLVGLRVEELDVFEARHERVLQWLRDGTIAGVRIDHVDGLRDPAKYLQRLRERAPHAWIVVEKILASDEHLPDWPIDGTTGYEFAEQINGLLTDPAGEAQMTAIFEEVTHTTFDAKAASRTARRDVMSDALHSEVMRLVELAAKACAITAAVRDYTRTEITNAIVEIIAGYPVYRTYMSDDVAPDRERIERAVQDARAEPELVSFLALALQGEIANARELAIAAQQVTGAIVAKGDEDTASYRLPRLASRCEVGADLALFARSPESVHRVLAAGPPRSLLATATHDTKRGEDTRMRIAAIAASPAAWREFVMRSSVSWGSVAPDRKLEYLLWQTLVGAWPITPERAIEYAIKAAREARTRTSWRSPNEDFEAALRTWVTTAIATHADQISAYVAELAPRARANSLAQLLVKLTAPGIPDIYQGCELADHALVDPDNRRPVDYDARAQAGEIGDDVGAAKLWIIRRVLRLRLERPSLFAAPYTSLEAHGPRADRVFAFMRGEDLVTVVPRCGAIDPETLLRLPTGPWRDALTDAAVDGNATVASLWTTLPVALLVR